MFATIVELTIERLTLAQTHLLDISHQQLQLVVSNLEYAIKMITGIVIVHRSNIDKGQIIQRLCLTITIALFFGQSKSLARIANSRIQIAVMGVVRLRIQTVHFRRRSVCTRKEQKQQEAKP